MDKKQAQERIKELRELTEYHAKRYYDDDDPEISDFEYDMLMVELRNLEKEYPEYIDKNSLTQVTFGPLLGDENQKTVQKEIMKDMLNKNNYDVNIEFSNIPIRY